MNKPKKSSIFKASVLAVLVGSAFSANAAGLGKLTVYSAIGQPLNAEVALEATSDELKSLSAKLASPEAFKEAGIDFLPALTGLHMSVAKSSSGESILRLTTRAPLNEPFMQFLVELSWTSGRMVREYTFLLDPPEMLKVTKQESVVAPSSPVVKAVSPVSAATRITPSSGMAPAAVREKKESAGDEVTVKLGDTLTKIANAHKTDAVSLDQMLVALFNNNRDAFIDGNMNRLRAGKILKLPDAETISKVGASEAHQIVVSQARDFNAYRRSLADAVTKMPAEAAESQQQVAGKIKPKVEEVAPPAPAKDKLEVSRTETSKSAAGSAARGKLEEELIARDKALREASERIAQLEKNLENLKTLAELKSQSGAQLQQQAQAAAAPDKKPEEPVATKPAEPAATPPAAAKPEEAAPPPPEAAKPAVPPPAQPKPVAKKPAPPPPPPPPEPSFVEDNPELVFGGGGILALLLGYLGFKALRKKKQVADGNEFESEPLVPEKPQLPKATEAASVVTSLGGGDDISILSDFSEGGTLTTDENVDPVQEADVLMAYGRDVQAEEILLEGKKKDPTRSAIHVKLLELYSNRKDAEKFISTAQDLHDLCKGQGADWAQASSFARVLGLSGSGLFAGEVTLGEESVSPEVVSVQVEQAVEPEVTHHEPSVVETPPVPVAEPEQPAAPAEEAASLDFDLDLGTTSMPSAVKAAESVPASPEPEEVSSLDFDFDLGSAGESTPAEEALASSQPVEPVSEAAVDQDLGNTIDFDLDLSSTPEPVPSIATPAEVESKGNDIDFDLDLGDSSGQEAETPEASASEVPEATASATVETGTGNDIDFDLDLGSDHPSSPEALVEAAQELESPALIDVPVTPAAPADLGFGEISLDLDASNLDLELPALEPIPAAAEKTEPEIELPALEPVSGVVPAPAPASDVADDPEVATKLELADAYEEMGDVEGARELLNEVLGEGSATQQALAQARLDKLGA